METPLSVAEQIPHHGSFLALESVRVLPVPVVWIECKGGHISTRICVLADAEVWSLEYTHEA